MALLGEAFVRVRPDTDGFEKEANSKIGGGLKRVAGAVAAAFASIKVGGFLKDSVTEASDFNETLSKSANIFGKELAPSIAKFASTAPKAFGISETAALGATAQFGNMFKQLGFTGDAAAKASTNLIKTAADLGSFNNVDPSDVLERIGASLRGEFDSLQQLIPNINAARVEHEALAATGKETAKQLTAQEKATATLAIIQKDGALAADDFAETSGGLANQQRILAATVDTLKRRLGEQFLPIATKVTTYLAANAEPAFNRVAEATTVFIEALRGASSPGKEFDSRLQGVHNAGIKVRETFDKIEPIIRKFVTEVRAGNVEVPNFAGVLDVGAAALKLVADNADLVVKALPFLIAGFVAVKTAQAAGNVAALASLPIQAATVVSNLAAASANRALATAIAQQTAIQNANAVVTTRGTVATIAHTVATAAATIASKAAAAAAKAWAATQWLLNAALAANPIGLVVVAIAALVGGVILAYRESETFRSIVQAVFRAVAGFVLEAVDKILGALEGIFRAASGIPGVGDKFKGVADKIAGARAKVDALQTGLDVLGRKKASPSIKLMGVGAAEEQLVRLERRITNIGGTQVRLPVRSGGTSTRFGGVRAGGGPVRPGMGYLVGEREPEWFEPDRPGQILNQSQMRGAGTSVHMPVTIYGTDNIIESALRSNRSELAFALSTGA